MKSSRIKLFMGYAELAANQSHAVRLKVGCVIVKGDNPVAISWNGTPHGTDNCCEDVVPDSHELVTKKVVIHAEQNAIIQMAKSNESIDESCVMFITHAPCITCAPAILQSGIRVVYYKNKYRYDSGVKYLVQHGVDVYKTGEL